MGVLKTKRKIKRLILAVFLIITGFFLFDAVWYEPRHPVLSVYDVQIPNLPHSMDGFKVLQLSDIHRRRIVPDIVIKRAVDMANSANPDIVVITGDFEGKLKCDVEPCFMMLGKLKAKRGCYAVFGNHDHWTGVETVSRSMKRHGIILLNNKNIRLEDNLYISGIDDLRNGYPDAISALKGIPNQAALIILSHDPQGVDLFKSQSGLLLGGHNHGGQVQLPLPGKWKYLGIINRKFYEGWYQVGNIQMYVNRGIGMINPGVRFHCRPEVTLFVLHPKR